MSTSPRTDPNRAPLRRIEIRPWHGDGRIFLSGRPGKRYWYANLRANPQLTLHVKSGAEGEEEMTAPAITDTGERARIASPNELDAWIEASPLVELTEVSRVTLPVATLSGTTSSTPDSAAVVGGRGVTRG